MGIRDLPALSNLDPGLETDRLGMLTIIQGNHRFGEVHSDMAFILSTPPPVAALHRMMS